MTGGRPTTSFVIIVAVLIGVLVLCLDIALHIATFNNQARLVRAVPEATNHAATAHGVAQDVDAPTRIFAARQPRLLNLFASPSESRPTPPSLTRTADSGAAGPAAVRPAAGPVATRPAAPQSGLEQGPQNASSSSHGAHQKSSAPTLLRLPALPHAPLERLPSSVVQISQGQTVVVHGTIGHAPGRPYFAGVPQIRHMGYFLGNSCIEINATQNGLVVLKTCQVGPEAEYQAFVYTAEGRLQLLNHSLCLDATDLKVGDLVVAKPCKPDTPGQLWDYRPPHVHGAPSALIRSRLLKDVCFAFRTKNGTTFVGLTECLHSCAMLFHVTQDQRPEAQRAQELPAVPDIDVAMRQRGPRLLCWIPTHPNATQRARAVYQTWGQRCNKIVFTSTADDEELPVARLELDHEESHQKLPSKVKPSWIYIYDNFYTQADWFMKADDDTYVVVDNMKVRSR